MRCPRCGQTEDKVVDSRTARDGDAIRRRRMCVECSHRFTTYEEVIRVHLRVVKRDARREDMDRGKLLNGVQRACEKRPVSAEQMDNLVDDIMVELESEFEREVPSETIGEKVMERLERIDDVAYVRFASVYRRFKDVNQFLSAIEGMIERP